MFRTDEMMFKGENDETLMVETRLTVVKAVNGLEGDRILGWLGIVELLHGRL